MKSKKDFKDLLEIILYGLKPVMIWSVIAAIYIYSITSLPIGIAIGESVLLVSGLVGLISKVMS